MTEVEGAMRRVVESVVEDFRLQRWDVEVGRSGRHVEAWFGRVANKVAFYLEDGRLRCLNDGSLSTDLTAPGVDARAELHAFIDGKVRPFVADLVK
jgi:hypothetical protein